MPRRTCRSIALPVVAVLTALVTGACGIPDETGVTEVGPGPTAGITSGNDRDSVQVTRQDTSDPVTFVQNYLKVAAGDLDSATDRMRSFMSQRAAAGFKPSNAGVRVIRLIGDPAYTPGSDVVTLTYEQVGTLDKFGLLDPATEVRTDKYEIKFESLASGLFVVEAPPALLLSTEALANSYYEQPLYFWNTDYTGLVPDIRYMPEVVPQEQRPTTVLNWLVNGPAPWLSVADLADGTALIGKVPSTSSNKLQVTLSAAALPATDTDVALQRLRQQLQWTLRPWLSSPGAELDLKVGFKDVGAFTGEDYLASNPAARLSSPPDRFVVYAGKIRRVAEGGDPNDPVPVLETEENKDVKTAAMSSSARYTFAAVVQTGKTDTLRVVAVPTGSQAALEQVTIPPGEVGTPAWAITRDDSPEGAIGLITVGGKLYSFAPKKGAVREIPWTGPGSRITSVAVAPDGRRVALVVDNKLYRASLTTGGDAPGLGNPQQIRPAGLSSVTAAAFTSEGWLTMAGIRLDNKRVMIGDVSIDGAQRQIRLSDLGDRPVTWLGTYPANPAETRSTGSAVSYVADGKAWEVLAKPALIGADKVAGLPSASPSAAPGVVPVAPFYLQ
ncbi:LpqB family beta-propeller domain-containing protein [Actinoplanes sp. NPDC020271]|uniref:LpqB family beta-propeller domain-containing protein n=1 Tax=Actinoplanes sp. NPDC020271 TaxID=3363896 RepID=UPI0037A91CAE